MIFDLDLYLQGYLAVTLPILGIIFICGTNTTHAGTMCYVTFPGQKVKSQGHMVHSNLCGRGGGILVDHWSIMYSFKIFT